MPPRGPHCEPRRTDAGAGTLTPPTPVTTADGAPRPPTVPWWRRPLQPDTWRQQLTIVLTVPTAVIALGLAVVGRPRTAATLQRRLAAGGTLEPSVRTAPAGRSSWLRVLALSLLSLPIGLVGVVVSGYTWLVVAMNLGYPLRPGLEYADAWGGPSLAGAWAVHAAGGLAFLVLAPWIVRGCLAPLRWLTDRLLGTGTAATAGGV